MFLCHGPIKLQEPWPLSICPIKLGVFALNQRNQAVNSYKGCHLLQHFQSSRRWGWGCAKHLRSPFSDQNSLKEKSMNLYLVSTRDWTPQNLFPITDWLKKHMRFWNLCLQTWPQAKWIWPSIREIFNKYEALWRNQINFSWETWENLKCKLQGWRRLEAKRGLPEIHRDSASPQNPSLPWNIVLQKAWDSLISWFQQKHWCHHKYCLGKSLPKWQIIHPTSLTQTREW